MNARGVIYMLTFPSGKSYIGQSRNFRKRMHEHARFVRKGSQQAVHCALRKYGWGGTALCVLSRGPVETLNARELMAVAKYSTLAPNGYNLTTGGERDFTVSDDIRAKIAAAAKGRVHTETARAKMAAAAKGRVMSEATRAKQRGRSVSQETRAKMREAAKRRPPRSAEVRAKISAALKGRVFAAETCAKISAAKRRKS